MRPAIILLVAGLVAGCVEPFDGSHIQFTLEGFQSPCEMLERYQLAGREKCSKDPLQDRFRFHYEMWATVRESAAVYLTTFTVQKHLFVDEQIDLEKKGVLLASGDPFSIGTDRYYYEMSADEKKTTLDRLNRVAAVNAITAFSSRQYDEADPNRLYEDFYLGSHVQLTRPHNGIYLGQVKGSHPFGAATLSGATVRVGSSLEALNSLWITIEDRDPERAEPDPGIIIVRGVALDVARGVTNVNAVSPYDATIRATFGVVTNLDEEEYF